MVKQGHKAWVPRYRGLRITGWFQSYIKPPLHYSTHDWASVMVTPHLFASSNFLCSHSLPIPTNDTMLSRMGASRTCLTLERKESIHLQPPQIRDLHPWLIHYLLSFKPHFSFCWTLCPGSQSRVSTPYTLLPG